MFFAAFVAFLAVDLIEITIVAIARRKGAQCRSERAEC
ncbi:hypothetical protein SAMN05421630_11577 [Prauserella marina]|uniref:Uncharacterized protein n=1 Tax=Prauserella marina TaxID=530584 RepID=A0A1G6Z499_9PSEU|nr:hypothetical protein DES30_11235 [Prauserella marina]SDD96636.1 hypothetical protein SAMN05421630_11577 [Prauserella marina]